MTRIHNIRNKEVPYTAEEETAADLKDAFFAEEYKLRHIEDARIDELEAKLADDSITFAEMKELMRLR